MDMTATFGCDGSQILYCKPGKDNGEFKHGISPGTMEVWMSQTGWALDCQVNWKVAMEGVQKSLFEDTDGDWIIDPLETDIDGDGIPNSQDSEQESAAPAPSKTGKGSPDWWCKDNPKKC